MFLVIQLTHKHLQGVYQGFEDVQLLVKAELLLLKLILLFAKEVLLVKKLEETKNT